MMIAGGREIDKEYYKFNLIPQKKDVEASFFYIKTFHRSF